jgi:hypothetical protein
MAGKPIPMCPDRCGQEKLEAVPKVLLRFELLFMAITRERVERLCISTAASHP